MVLGGWGEELNPVRWEELGGNILAESGHSTYPSNSGGYTIHPPHPLSNYWTIIMNNCPNIRIHLEIGVVSEWV